MLETKYDHKKVEADRYQDWIQKGYFTAGDLSKKPYCIEDTRGIRRSKIFYLATNGYKDLMFFGFREWIMPA